MKLVHYSTTPNLTVLEPSKIGTSGVKSEWFKAGRPSIGITYFYKEGTKPESLVTSAAKHKYITKLSPEQKIYDTGADEEGIFERALEAAGGHFWHPMDFHKALIDAGYHGYHNPHGGNPNAVALFYPQPVKQILNDPKGHKNTSFGDEYFTEFDTAQPTEEELVRQIVNELLG